jgi:hypothetical protein
MKQGFEHENNKKTKKNSKRISKEIYNTFPKFQELLTINFVVNIIEVQSQ